MDHLDLTNCDKEPIHIPGKIQSHGFLIAFSAEHLKVTYVSENTADYLQLRASELLDQTIQAFSAQLSKITAEDIDLEQLILLGKRQDGFEVVNPYRLRIKDAPYNLIIHRSGTDFVLEFEQATLTYDIQNIIGKSVSEILVNKPLKKLLKIAAIEVKKLIDYDRVMIYQFHEDGHGEVVAEAKNEELEAFLGLHYPASDIPKQARELYMLNKTRIIVDVHTAASSILALSAEEPLDLTHSALRAVSPIHIQYLKNMGVASSFSISLIAKGQLWGLIACHNYSPKFIDFKAREGSRLIGNILSSALEYRQVEEENEQQSIVQRAIDQLIVQLESEPTIGIALTAKPTNLQHAVSSTGVAMLFEDQLYTIGQVPAPPHLKALLTWLKLTMNESIYHTANLSANYKLASEFTASASGILACMLSKDMGELIVWFRSEMIQTVTWAGNPEKPVEEDANGILQISPRHSFESWSETVKNTAKKWEQQEINGILRLKEKINNVINKKANEIRLLNDRLKLAYEELDTFSYTVSHDLRTPLTAIKSYTELFLSKNPNLEQPAQRLLDRVLISADKMRFLIDEILKLARVGRSEMELAKINMASLIKDITTEVVLAFKAQHVSVEVGNCLPLDGDHTLISQVFTNIISNAIKYSSRADEPKVTIDSELNDEEIIYKISDNGIGIDAVHHDKVFELFKRMENVKDFEGTGVGLAIVKRIIERHNARIWFESALGQGTTFYLAFKKL